MREERGAVRHIAFFDFVSYLVCNFRELIRKATALFTETLCEVEVDSWKPFSKFLPFSFLL